MAHTVSKLILGAALVAGALMAQSALPPDAVVIERVPIPGTIHENRELILWMLSPARHDRGAYSAAHAYTCPETTVGSYYSGPTRLSLADTSTHRLINTEEIAHRGRGPDSFNLPYRILPGVYDVPNTAPDTEGKPSLLTLRDTNGDGLAAEVVFFDAESCAALQTTLLGYSAKQDRVIHYELELRTTDYLQLEESVVQDGDPETSTAVWIESLFAMTPDQPAHWSYEIDYREFKSPLFKYDIRYDASREKFVGTLKSIAAPKGQY